MTDVISQIVDDCRTYWLHVNIPRVTANEMSAELNSHLIEARSDGKNPQGVVGEDLPAFAAAWADERRPNVSKPLPSWNAVQSQLAARPQTQLLKWVSVAAVLAVIVTAMITAGKGSIVDNEVWRWVWVGLAVFMSLAEIFTAGFFMLPFAIGAGLAAVAAWLDLGGAVQWVLFFAGTGVSMLYLRRFMRLQDEGEASIAPGPLRYVGMTAFVLQTIDRSANTGRVRVETDEWRAISDTDDPIVEGATVQIVELRGTRLVVSEVS